METTSTAIEGVLIIEQNIFSDDRGFFLESWNQKKFNQAVGEEINFVQDNHSHWTKGVLRGLHYQLPPYTQSKLVRVIEGSVLDVAVDIRRSSPTFGQHVAVELTSENKHQLFVPRGFAHGFVVLSNDTIFSYKVDNYYSPEYDRGILFSDPDLSIDWRLHKDILISSPKDLNHPRLEDADDLFD